MFGRLLSFLRFSFSHTKEADFCSLSLPLDRIQLLHRSNSRLQSYRISPLTRHTPILETRQPASCAADCYFSISEQQFNDPSTLQLIESSSPGCGTCPGHNCTGKADATITSLDGKTQWIYEYWVRHPLILPNS